MAEWIEAIPNSPIAGEDDVPIDVGAGEVRRARLNVELVYRCPPEMFVDIQGTVFDILGGGGESLVTNRDDDLGGVIVTVDLTEHVRFIEGGSDG